MSFSTESSLRTNFSDRLESLSVSPPTCSETPEDLNVFVNAVFIEPKTFFIVLNALESTVLIFVNATTMPAASFSIGLASAADLRSSSVFVPLMRSPAKVTTAVATWITFVRSPERNVPAVWAAAPTPFRKPSVGRSASVKYENADASSLRLAEIVTVSKPSEK